MSQDFDRHDSPAERYRTEQCIDPACAVGESVQPDADSIEQRQVQIRQRRGRGEPEVATATRLAAATAGYQDGQVHMIVHVRIAHAAAVEDERVIEQGAVAFRYLCERLEEMGEERHVE